MAEIALAVRHALAQRRRRGEPGRTAAQVLARGEDWTVSDVVCTAGPHDAPFEEQHTGYSIAIVLTGAFQYRSALGDALMTPGSLMLGNPGQCFECGHEHGEGDRCVSFWYAPQYFERLAGDAGCPRTAAPFAVPRVPPLRPINPIVAAAATGVVAYHQLPWEELVVTLAARAMQLASGVSGRYRVPINAEARISRSARLIDRRPAAPLTLESMAREAGLSPYHFLRTFQRVTGVTPHQYVLRARLRDAALRLSLTADKIVDIALSSGFGDVSNFNHAFRREFGRSPRQYRHLSVPSTPERQLTPSFSTRRRQ